MSGHAIDRGHLVEVAVRDDSARVLLRDANGVETPHFAAAAVGAAIIADGSAPGAPRPTAAGRVRAVAGAVLVSAIVAFDLPGAHVTLACFGLGRALDAHGLDAVADAMRRALTADEWQAVVARIAASDAALPQGVRDAAWHLAEGRADAASRALAAVAGLSLDDWHARTKAAADAHVRASTSRKRLMGYGHAVRMRATLDAMLAGREPPPVGCPLAELEADLPPQVTEWSAPTTPRHAAAYAAITKFHADIRRADGRGEQS